MSWKVGLVFCISLGLTSCAGVSVKKPEAKGIHKVAIVSLFANQKVFQRGGKGMLKGWTTSDMTRLADETFHAFEAEISSTLAWDVYSAERVLKTAEYQNFKAMTTSLEPARKPADGPPTLEAPAPEGYFHPLDLLPIPLDEASIGKAFGPGEPGRLKAMQQLGKLAADLEMDGVMVIQIDLSYSERRNQKGKREAVGSAATSVKVVDKQGNFLVDMPVLAPGSGKNRAESKTVIPSYQEELTFKGLAAEEIHTILIEAVRGSARMAIGQIKNALN